MNSTTSTIVDEQIWRSHHKNPSRGSAEKETMPSPRYLVEVSKQNVSHSVAFGCISVLVAGETR